MGTPILKTITPNTLEAYNLEDVNLVVVTFASGTQTEAHATGFAFEYEASFSGNINATSVRSTHHIFESPTFEFHYPNRAGNYDGSELAAFVFPPVKNIYTGAPKHIFYKQQMLQNNCADSLYVFTYNKTTTQIDNKWALSGQICYDLDTQYIPYEDLVLILFQTNPQTYEHAGFWFSFTGC